MTTTVLSLFDLTALTPNTPPACGRCGNRPATLRVYAIQNLLGVHPTYMTGTWYRNAFHRAHSGPCCTKCAWQHAGAWWGPVYACTGSPSCHLWAHTLDAPRPGWDCTRHHHERTVVWQDRLGVAA